MGARHLWSRLTGVSRSWFTNASKGACPVCKACGVIVTELAFLESTVITCGYCNYTVFNEISLGYYFDNRNIAELMAMPVDQVASLFTDPDVGKMLECLRHVGLRYLTIGRSTSTLSGGERQRVKLASVLDEDVDMLILGEPTTGLHGMGVTRLLTVINGFVERGVIVLMVEHNLDAMLAADGIIDLGPDAGSRGGKVM